MIACRDGIRIVNDQIGYPTWADSVADATVQILVDHWSGDSDRLEALSGLYHMAADGQASWYEFARDIVATLGAKTTVSPISSTEFGAPAKRPAFSVLNTEKLQRTFGLALSYWKDHLRSCLAQ